jgi:hypothetical protein
MLESSRIKAIKEIKTKLEEREKLIKITARLEELENEGKWEEYLDYLIEWQDFLIKFKNRYGNEPKEMMGLYENDISIPDYDSIVEKTFSKYSDGKDSIYFYPSLYDYVDGRRISGYTSLEDEDKKISTSTFRSRKLSQTIMTIELDNPDANYFLYQSWFFKLLMDHNMEETYEILKRVSECDNSVYNKTINSSNNKILVKKH